MTGGVRSTGRARVAADLGIPARVHLAFSFGFVFENEFQNLFNAYKIHILSYISSKFMNRVCLE
jgi:hypothetical protein